MEATTHCQLKCPTCATATGELYQHMARGFLRFDDFKRFIDENGYSFHLVVEGSGRASVEEKLARVREICGAQAIFVGRAEIEVLAVLLVRKILDAGRNG